METEVYDPVEARYRQWKRERQERERREAVPEINSGGVQPALVAAPKKQTRRRLKKYLPKKWTSERIAQVKEMSTTHTAQQIAEAVSTDGFLVTRTAVTSVARRNGFRIQRRRKPKVEKPPAEKRWTPEKIQIVRELVEAKNNREIVAHFEQMGFNTTVPAVSKVIMRNEIVRSAAAKNGIQKRAAKATARRNRERGGDKSSSWKGGVSREHMRYRNNYKRRYPKRYAAQRLLASAIQKGAVVRCACQVCGSSDYITAHFKSFEKPLDVNWFCYKHRREQPSE